MQTALAPQRAGLRPAAGLRAASTLPLRPARSVRAAVRPQAISQADDEIKEQSRKFRRTVSAALGKRPPDLGAPQRAGGTRGCGHRASLVARLSSGVPPEERPCAPLALAHCAPLSMR